MSDGQPLRTAEQERAAFALQLVQSVSGEARREFKPLAQSAPADIQANGLAQTLAFWKAKNKPHHQKLYGGVSQWVGRQMGLGERADVLEWITRQASSVEYRRATAHALAVLLWIKRFAEAEIRDQGSRPKETQP